MQYKNLLAALDLTITPAFTNDQKELQFKAAKNGSHHLGANVFVSARQDNPCVDIRQYWKPSNYTTIVPTKRGLCLRPTEFKALQSYISDIEKLLPELKDVIPCYMRDDHFNQLGMMSCKNCNPNEFYKWWITFTLFFFICWDVKTVSRMYLFFFWQRVTNELDNVHNVVSFFCFKNVVIV